MLKIFIGPNGFGKTYGLEKIKKSLFEEDTFGDLQETYEFSKNHDYSKDKDDFEMEI